jgi:LPS export ABC transporter protein LptC
MTRRAQWLLIAALLAAVPLLLWLLLRGPVGEPLAPALRRVAATPRPTPTPARGQIPPVEAEQTTITTADDKGRKQWEIHADVVVVDSGSNTARLTNVRGTYFQKGEPAVTFSAPRGVFYIQTRNVALVDGVHAAATSGRMIDARQVTWSMQKQVIEAAGSVVLRQKGLVVRADRVTTDLRLTTAKLEGNVRVDVDE